MSTPLFISLEGVEGMGKSTALKFIESELKAHALPFIVTREPGGTQIAEGIRDLLLKHHDEKMHPDTEALLMFAARAQNVANVIKPALAAGKWVLSDRFTDASFAYQAGGRHIDAEHLGKLAHWVLGDFKPNLTLLLDAPIEVGLERIKRRQYKDRIEKEDICFFERVRKSYLTRARNEPDRFRIIQAHKPLPEVKADIKAALAPFLIASAVPCLSGAGRDL